MCTRFLKIYFEISYFMFSLGQRQAENSFQIFYNFYLIKKRYVNFKDQYFILFIVMNLFLYYNSYFIVTNKRPFPEKQKKLKE